MNILIPVLLALAPFQVESSRFNIYVNGQEVGTEDFTIVKNGSGFLARGRTQIEIDGESVDVQSRMELDEEFKPVLYELSSDAQLLKVRIGAALTEVEFQVEGQKTPYDIRFPAGGMIIDDNFFHHYLLLLHRFNGTGGSVSVLVPQQMTVGNLQIEVQEEHVYLLTSDNLRLRATTDAEGRLLRLEGIDSDVVVER